MKLLTKEIEKKLPALYSTENTRCEDKIAQVKFFHPLSDWTWYGIEYNPAEKLFWGLVCGFDNEYGYFSLDELESITKLGLGVERDVHFSPAKISEILERGY